MHWGRIEKSGCWLLRAECQAGRRGHRKRVPCRVDFGSHGFIFVRSEKYLVRTSQARNVIRLHFWTCCCLGDIGVLFRADGILPIFNKPRLLSGGLRVW